MSAGRFVRSRYAAVYNGGTAIHPIKIQPETQALSIADEANDPPDGAINNPISAVVSRGVNARGLRPATVTLRWTGLVSAAAGNLGTTTVPLLNQTIRDAAATADDTTDVTYLGATTWVVVGYKSEVAQ